MHDAEFTEFAAAAAGRLHSLALGLARHPHEADDLVQGVLLRLMERWRRRGAPEEPFSYARAALVKAHLSEVRRARWRHELSTGAPPERAERRSSTRLVDDRLLLQEALDQLTLRQRQVVVLRHLEDLSTREVADLLGISEGAVKSTASHAMTRLRTLIPSFSADEQESRP